MAWIWTVFGLGLLGASGEAFAQASPPRYLTPASNRDAADIATDDLRARGSQLGLSADDLDELRVRDRYVTRRTGTTHLYLCQQVDGVDVFGSNVTIAIDRRGRMIARNERLTRDLRRRIHTRQPGISASEALARAADHLGLPAGPAGVLRRPGGPAREVVFEPDGISRDEIPVKLMYVPRPGAGVPLAWNVVIRMPDSSHWWNLHVDAVSGQVLRQNDWMARDSYRIYPLPQMSPDEGPRLLDANPADPTASPFGWHDTNGALGAEFTDTRGNNVSAQEDDDADDSLGLRPDGGASLVFDFPVDPSLQPSGNWQASVSNLFYWNNRLHDIFYHYGFDEPAGNFQVNNYGKGGVAGDPVQADAFDGGGDNNANFGTPPEPSSFDPRMQMYYWLSPTVPELEILSPPSAQGTYAAAKGRFGGGTPGLTDDVVQAIPNDACSTLTNSGAISGRIALVDRGTCLFIEKVAIAQAAGAVGVIIVNNAGNDLVNMIGFDPTLTIPTVFVGQTDGGNIEAELGNSVTATLVAPTDRDSDFDNGIVIHEYGHGVSNRLTGGPSDTSCLAAAQSSGMGEGWSDFFALALTARVSDLRGDAVPLATYLEFQPLTGSGIRNHPYSTSLVTNPLTYEDIEPPTNHPHGVGEVWAVSLWEMFWNLVDVYGFDPNVAQGSGGNNLAMELVMDGMKLQSCNPTFLNARQGILTADQDANDAANRCLIWAAFAKRGLGLAATDGGGSGSLNVTEDFSTPAECSPSCGDGLLQVGEQCDDENSQSFDHCTPACENETIFAFFGTASGGSIDLVLDGLPLSITTLLGQSAAIVAANVAAAINADPDLMAAGVTALPQDHRVATNGDLTSLTLNDPGLLFQVPALSGPALGILAGLFAWLGARGLRQRA